MKNIAIIPARGGSKGIPHKNIYPINNKPLISYVLNALKNSIVDECYTTTDCQLIADVAKEYGSKIIDRPPELATDTSPTIDCVVHALNTIKAEENDLILIVQPTSPLIKPTDITNIIDTFNLGSYDTIITTTENHNILWKLNDDNTLSPQNHIINKRLPRQLAPKVFAETGSVYATKAKNIYDKKIFGERIGHVEIPKSRSYEIDNYEDVKIIESILNEKQPLADPL